MGKGTRLFIFNCFFSYKIIDYLYFLWKVLGQALVRRISPGERPSPWTCLWSLLYAECQLWGPQPRVFYFGSKQSLNCWYLDSVKHNAAYCLEKQLLIIELCHYISLLPSNLEFLVSNLLCFKNTPLIVISLFDLTNFSIISLSVGSTIVTKLYLEVLFSWYTLGM